MLNPSGKNAVQFDTGPFFHGLTWKFHVKSKTHAFPKQHLTWKFHVKPEMTKQHLTWNFHVKCDFFPLTWKFHVKELEKEAQTTPKT